MKKVLYIAFITSFASLAQQFEITPKGLFDKDNNEKPYLVIEAPTKDSITLFNNAIKFINETFENPDKVIKSQIIGDYIRYEGFSPKFTKAKNGGVNIDIDCKYTIELRFKHGRVKYEITSIGLDASNGGGHVIWQGSPWKGYPIYNKKGKVRMESTKTDIEDYFNKQVNRLSGFLNDKKTKKDDW